MSVTMITAEVEVARLALSFRPAATAAMLAMRPSHRRDFGYFQQRGLKGKGERVGSGFDFASELNGGDWFSLSGQRIALLA